jgi:hypothetical protein
MVFILILKLGGNKMYLTKYGCKIKARKSFFLVIDVNSSGYIKNRNNSCAAFDKLFQIIMKIVTYFWVDKVKNEKFQK